MTGVIRLLVADDHALVRATVRRLIDAMDGIRVVGEACNGRETIEAIERTRPDVVVLDILMPELNGLDSARQILERHPQTRILYLSMHNSPDYVRHARIVGARGYILKESSAEEMEQAIRAVADDGDWFPASDECPAGSARSPDAFDLLSPRQREVLQLLAEGNSTRRIAEKMGITENTVEKHREKIMEELNLHDLASLVRFAIRAGLTQADFR